MVGLDAAGKTTILYKLKLGKNFILHPNFNRSNKYFLAHFR